MQPGGPNAPPPMHPIDHGWAWMVCLGAFVTNFFVTGGMRSLGILLVELIEQFDAEPSVAAIAIGLVAAGIAIFGALGNGFGMVLTNRVVVLVGAGLIFVSMLLTAYAPNIIVVIIFLGFFSGMGNGFLFGPSIVTVGQYFAKRRSLANGLAVGGGSVGQLVLPLFLNAAMAEFGFQGALLIYAGLMLHAIPGGLLLRPPSFYNRGKKAVEMRRAQAAKEKEERKMKELEARGDLEKGALLDDGELHPDKRDIYSSQKSLENVHLQEPLDVEEEVSEATTIDQGTQTKPPRPSFGAILCLILHKLFDKYLLTNLMFLCVATGISLGHGGYLNVLFLLPRYCMELFGSKQKGAFLLSIMGISDLVGRILGGWFSDLGFFQRSNIIGCSFVICGIGTILMPLLPLYPVIITYSVIAGVIGGTYMALMAVVIVDLFGLPMLAAGMGLQFMIMGLFSIPLPTIMGIISTNASVALAIRVCGIMLVVGGVLYYLIPCARNIENRKEETRKRKNVVKVDADVQVKPSDFTDNNAEDGLNKSFLRESDI